MSDLLARGRQQRFLFNLQRRWLVVTLLFLASVINYVDRQSLSLLVETIQPTFGLTNVSYGNIVTGFLISYTACFAFAGPLVDRLGVRKSMTISILWWSLAEIVPCTTHSLAILGLSRVLLGLGEAGIWIAAPKAVGELFAVDSRAVAIGFYTAGASVGAVVSPLLVSSLTVHFGWRSVFLSTGLAGLLWVVPWRILYKPGGTERVPVSTTRGELRAQSFRALLVRRNLWLLMFVRMITDPLWYFLLFWFPKYLSDARHLSLESLGHTVWIVYLAADVGSIAGGWTSGMLIRRGVQPLRARRAVLCCAAALIPLMPLIPLAGSQWQTIVIASIVAFAHMTWLATIGATILDLFPGSEIATVFGLIAAGSGLGGIVSTELIAHSIGHSGYLAAFIALGLFHPFALIPLYRLKIQRDDRGPSMEQGGAIGNEA